MTNTLVNVTDLTKNAGSDFTTQGNMPVQESQLMTIDMANAAFIMDSLTNLYSDPTLSVMREYIANGIDSHIMAGNNAPVEVTLPSSWQSMLIIKDQGIGMSKDDVFRYGTYGGSDKRDNLQVVGNFGMGSKSALAITNTFTVEAVKDGEYTKANIGRDDDGHGKIDILSNEPTDLPNGVTISIPISSYSGWYMKDKIDRVIKYLPAGTVSVDGKINEDIRDGYTTVSDDVHILGITPDRLSLNGIDVTIVSGGFGYDVPWDFDYPDTHGTHSMLPDSIIIDVPTGSVDLTPSRESLRMTSRTKNLIATAVISVVDTVEEQLEDRIKEVKDYDDAVSLIIEYSAGTVRSAFISPLIKKVTSIDHPSETKSFATELRTDTKTYTSYTSSNTRHSDDDIFYLIASNPKKNKILILDNDKDYKPSTLTSRVRKYLSAVADDAGDISMVLTIDPNYSDDASNTKDNLYRYVMRHSDAIKASDIYAAVREYDKSLSGTPKAKTGSGDDAIISAGTVAVSGDIKYESFTAGTMDTSIDGFFNTDHPTVVILNNTKVSGLDVDYYDLKRTNKLLSAVAPDLVSNFVVIDKGNRKKDYFTSRGVNVVTPEEFYSSITDALLSDDAKDLYKALSSTDAIDELPWGFEHTCNKIMRILGDDSKDRIDNIRDELRITIDTATTDNIEKAGGSSQISTTLRIAGAYTENTELTELAGKAGGARMNNSRYNLVDNAIDTIESMAEAGHTEEAYGILVMLENLLTNKKED